MTVDQLIAKLKEIRNQTDERGVTKGDYEITLDSFFDPMVEIVDVDHIVDLQSGV